MSAARFGNVEAEASGEQCPGHVGKGEEEERSSAERIDGEECWPGEDEVDETESEGGDQSFAR